MTAWEPVIGIEVHVELFTRSKMFCGCRVDFHADPNTNVCPVCLGLPGSLPVPNERAIDWIVAIGLALDCEIAPWSQFHRKNYFYADLPKNYQISQYDVPICRGGRLPVEVDGVETVVRIERVHMEEDTGKSLHVGEGGRIHAADHTLLDFNRAGTPLVEIVTEPDIFSARQARAYAQELRATILALGVSDAKLEEGSMRFDANVSVRPVGSDELGTKVEIKNMNSFRSLERALEYEIARLTAAASAGEEIVQETRHWDEAAGVTHAMRTKEGSSDYRYFPEPDLVPIIITEEKREAIRASLPELPRQRRSRLRSQGVDDQAIGVLVGDTDLAALFDAAVAEGGDPRRMANWLTGEVVAILRRAERTTADLAIDGAGLAQLGTMVEDGSVSASAAKRILEVLVLEGGDPRAVAEAHDLLQVSDADTLAAVVEEALAAHPDERGRLAGGENKLVGFFVGEVMRRTHGKADPRLVAQLVRERA